MKKPDCAGCNTSWRDTFAPAAVPGPFGLVIQMMCPECTQRYGGRRMSQKVNVTRHYTIQFDGDIEAYVKCADILSKATGMGELDSYDAGDATGFWMTAYHMEAAGAPDFDGTFIFRSDDPKLLVTVVADDDLFEWDPPL